MSKMNIIKRFYNLKDLIKPHKVLVLYGPRQVGKTTLLNAFLKETKLKYKLDSGDNIRLQHVLGSQDFKKIIEYASGYDLIAIDEVQQITNIGVVLKILIDQMPDLRIIATGSSSFGLAQKIGEPLTGRKNTIILYPFAQLELLGKYNKYELREKLEDFLIFGSYPEVITSKTKEEKITILQELVDSYLLKDVLALEKIKGSAPLLELLKLIAFQIGAEVSLSELASRVKIDVKTVGRYLDILEKAFVIKKIGSFGRNLRNEVSTKSKYYFLDNGIRNAVISQFNSLANRNDIGVLFENFIMMERIKKRSYKKILGQSYFWRTYAGQEIDLIEEREGNLYAFELKWSPKKNKKAPIVWSDNYKNSKYKIITSENYLDFIL